MDCQRLGYIMRHSLSQFLGVDGVGFGFGYGALWSQAVSAGVVDHRLSYDTLTGQIADLVSDVVPCLWFVRGRLLTPLGQETAQRYVRVLT